MERKLPEGWKLAKLRELVSNPNNDIVDGPFGSNLKASEYVDKGVPIIRLQNIDRNSFINKNIMYVTNEKARELKRHNFSSGDIVITKLGSPLGKACLVPSDLNWGIIVADVVRVRPNDDFVLREYLVRAINSDIGIRQFEPLVKGTTRPRVNLGNIRDLIVPVPPFEIQRRIVTILDKAEETRRLRAQADDLAMGLIQSIFLEIFGDPATNPRGWDTLRLKDISEKFGDGPFGSNLKTEHYTDDGIRVIRLKNIGAAKFINDDQAYISEEHFSTLRKHTCNPGDVLIGTMGDPNLRACILPKFITLAINKADCVQCRPDQDIVLPEYICHLLNLPSIVSVASKLVHGETRGRISSGQLGNLSIPIPPISFQKRFTHIIETADKMMSNQMLSKIEIQKTFDSLLQKAFTGELIA